MKKFFYILALSLSFLLVFSFFSEAQTKNNDFHLRAKPIVFDKIQFKEGDKKIHDSLILSFLQRSDVKHHPRINYLPNYRYLYIAYGYSFFKQQDSLDGTMDIRAYIKKHPHNLIFLEPERLELNCRDFVIYLFSNDEEIDRSFFKGGFGSRKHYYNRYKM